MNIEHIIPISAGGTSELSNLCYACAWCNSFKWAKSHGIDPVNNEEVPLFNPRTQKWHHHFSWSDDGVTIMGATASGRVTVNALEMNNEFIVPARRLWRDAGWHPPIED